MVEKANNFSQGTAYYGVTTPRDVMHTKELVRVRVMP